MTAFVEGQKISQIDFVSDSWWQGTLEDGSVGVFPGEFYTRAADCDARLIDINLLLSQQTMSSWRNRLVRVPAIRVCDT